MIRVVIGSLVAAVAMFILGFVFYAMLGGIMVSDVGDSEAAAIQSVLAANMENDGARAVMVPSGEGTVQQRMYLEGPIALIHYNPEGQEIGGTATLFGGFVHFLISALILGGALYSLAGHVREFSQRAAILTLFVLGASVFMHLGSPIWWHQSWLFHGYAFFADAVIYITGGLIIARFFLPRNVRTEDTYGAEDI